MERISNPPANPKKAMFGSNKHEGSFVLGSKKIEQFNDTVKVISYTQQHD